MNNILIETIIQSVQAMPWYNVAAAVVALASSVAAVTRTPKKGTALSKVYRVVDFLALNVGKAKDK